MLKGCDQETPNYLCLYELVSLIAVMYDELNEPREELLWWQKWWTGPQNSSGLVNMVEYLEKKMDDHKREPPWSHPSSNYISSCRQRRPLDSLALTNFHSDVFRNEAPEHPWKNHTEMNGRAWICFTSETSKFEWLFEVPKSLQYLARNIFNTWNFKKVHQYLPAHESLTGSRIVIPSIHSLDVFWVKT